MNTIQYVEVIISSKVTIDDFDVVLITLREHKVGFTQLKMCNWRNTWVSESTINAHGGKKYKAIRMSHTTRNCENWNNALHDLSRMFSVQVCFPIPSFF